MAQKIVAVSLQVDGNQANQTMNQFGKNTETANQSVKNLKAEIKEATLGLQQAQKQYGDYSKEALAAAKSLAELRDRQKEAAETAALFDPGAKLQAFTNVAKTAAGSMSAFTGTLALAGVESEDLQKSLVKVQAAMAISEGVSTIADSVKDFDRLGAVIKSTTVYQTLYNFVVNGTTKTQAAQVAVTEAQAVAMEGATVATEAQAVAEEGQAVATVTATTATGGLITAMGVLRLALIATGIGAIIVLLVAAYQAMSKFANAAADAAEKQKVLNEQTKKYAEVGLQANLKAAKDATDLEVARAKARGAHENEVEKIQRDGLQRQANALKAHYNEIKDIDDEAAQKDLEDLKDLQKQSDLLHADHDSRDLEKHKQYLADKLQQDLDDSKTREALDKSNAVLANAREDDITQIGIDAQKHRIELLGQYATTVKGIDDEAYKQALKDKKAAEEALTQIQKDEEVKRYNDLKALNEKIRKEGYGAVQGAGDITAVNQERKDLHNPVPDTLPTNGLINDGSTDKIASQQQAVKDAQDKTNALTPVSGIAGDLVNYQSQLKDLNSFYDEKLKLVERGSDEETAIIKAKAEAQKQIQLSTASSILNGAADMLGKQTAAGKAAAIAATTIDTYQSATAAFKAMAGIPVIGPALGAVAAGLAIASGIKNVKAILATKTPGPDVSGGAGISVSAPIVPTVIPQATSTKIDQDQINQIGNAAGRAYVLDSDVQNNRERDTRINRAARLG